MNAMKQVKALQAAIAEAAPYLSDKTAVTVAWIYPTMKYNNETIEAGTRINFNGDLKRAISSIEDIEDNSFFNNPDLWEDVTG